MPQLFFSVERPVADELARRAAAENLSLSQYLARLVREQIQTEWPDGYLSAVIGCCADDPLREPPDEAPDEVELQSPRQAPGVQA
ncbi:hypothetical protein [uncultured Thiohalocapsa sp.]|uniref:hypothetical protein n=1 Tax=uncultured Thiohalocapsa sp. TaxID=768990 RepID=UPI0025F0E692|nr:hypothetical protein [uncultured Thiohalocapsa sp.]